MIFLFLFVGNKIYKNVFGFNESKKGWSFGLDTWQYYGTIVFPSLDNLVE